MLHFNERSLPVLGLTIVCLIVAAILTVTGYQTLQLQLAQRAEAEVAREAALLSRTISAQLDDSLHALYSGRAYLVSDADDNQAAWAAFFRNHQTFQDDTGIRSVSVAVLDGGGASPLYSVSAADQPLTQAFAIPGALGTAQQAAARGTVSASSPLSNGGVPVIVLALPYRTENTTYVIGVELSIDTMRQLAAVETRDTMSFILSDVTDDTQTRLFGISSPRNSNASSVAITLPFADREWQLDITLYRASAWQQLSFVAPYVLLIAGITLLSAILAFMTAHYRSTMRPMQPQRSQPGHPKDIRHRKD